MQVRMAEGEEGKTTEKPFFLQQNKEKNFLVFS
jgi:hypothetical protein